MTAVTTTSSKMKAAGLAMLCLFQSSAMASTLEGSVVVPMGQYMNPIEVEFYSLPDSVDFVTIQSHGLPREDGGYFKVSGPVDCINFVSTDKIIISGQVLGTAMHQSLSFFGVGEKLLLAMESTGTGSLRKVSTISRIDASQDCFDHEWTEFTVLSALAGEVHILD
ncbi:expressed unknown protein [Seminavis robusta]|uniref:Uncharacterized protein n=1 Tax=Seminavis robusta TaxID=568900 RepID=A0A9N8HMV6_9STRA|nr:expressed unknown protein [Seminavis robusta]|eukprot:Sro933_g221780.1 n/a (166) ;mRNA; f:18581-19078